MGKVDGPFQGAVGDNHLLDALGNEMLGREFGHLAGAGQQHAFFVQVAEDFPGHLHRGIADRDGAAADVGFGPDPLGNGEGLVEKTVEQQAGGLGFRRAAIGLFELAQDLRFADDHRVQAGGHPKEVIDRVAVLVQVAVFPGVLIRQAALGKEKAAHAVGGLFR